MRTLEDKNLAVRTEEVKYTFGGNPSFSLPLSKIWPPPPLQIIAVLIFGYEGHEKSAKKMSDIPLEYLGKLTCP